jgi:alpha-tubulin suppressor-like RCC1 family protein
MILTDQYLNSVYIIKKKIRIGLVRARRGERGDFDYALPGLSEISLNAGYGHTCALQGNSGVMCWGGNSGGQLGIGNRTNMLVPAAVNLGAGPNLHMF